MGGMIAMFVVFGIYIAIVPDYGMGFVGAMVSLSLWAMTLMEGALSWAQDQKAMCDALSALLLLALCTVTANAWERSWRFRAFVFSTLRLIV